MSRKRKTVIVIRRSCITGKVVWVYRGKSRGAAYVAYHRACRMEVQRVRHWSETAAERRARILGMLNEWLEDLGITDTLTPEQAVAARQIQELANEDIACDREFYEHIMEERRRRAEIRKFRKEEREHTKRN